MNKYIILLTLLVLPIASATVGYGEIDYGVNWRPADDFEFDINVTVNGTLNHSNSSDYANIWITDEGYLDNVDDIEHNWLKPSSLFWSVAGHIIDAILDMNGYGIEEVDYVEFDGGEIVDWNPTDYTIDVPTGLGPVNQVGQEDYEIVWNNLGIQANNGQVIYWDNVSSTRPTIGLAYSSSQDISEKTIGFLTMNISDGNEGIATTRGRVREIDTSSSNLGDIVYLHPDTPGAWTTNRPDDGNFIVTLGMICKVGTTDGEICVRNALLVTPNDLNDASGFPDQNALPLPHSIDFNDATRNFTISVNTGASFTDYYYWNKGVKYTKTSNETIQIPDEAGSYWFYFNASDLFYVKNPNDGFISQAIRDYVTIAYVYWDNSSSEHIYLGDERHGHVMSADTHAYLHFTQGVLWNAGFALSDIIADGDGGLNVSAQFGHESGTAFDEDKLIRSGSSDSTQGLPIYYLSNGATSHRIYESNFSVLTDITAGVGVTGRLVYNDFTGGVWSLQTVDDNDYVLAHIFGTNDLDDQVFSFVGQADYLNIIDARAGAETEISSIVSNFPAQEIFPIATIIYQTRDLYGNGVKARIRSTDLGEDYIDWRTTKLEAGAAPSDHSNLAGLAWPGGHTGTANTFAGFNAGGIGTTYTESNYFLVDGSRNVTGNLNVDENVTADYFFGDGSQLTGISGGGGTITVNLTVATYNGDTGGYNSSNTLCDAEFTGSSLCTEFDVINWFNQQGYGTTGDAWVSTGSPKYIPATVPVNDCNGWTYSGTSTYLGNYWHFNVTEGGDGRAINCGTSLKLACCTFS